jgi:hypothetical protein
VVNGLNPAGLFIMMGLVNIATGLVYRLPMPVEPKKVVSVAAIAQHWPRGRNLATRCTPKHPARWGRPNSRSRCRRPSRILASR